MAITMKVIGSWINRKVMARNFGWMVPIIRVNIEMVKSTEMEHSDGIMGITIKDSSITTKLKGRGSLHG